MYKTWSECTVVSFVCTVYQIHTTQDQIDRMAITASSFILLNCTAQGFIQIVPVCIPYLYLALKGHQSSHRGIGSMSKWGDANKKYDKHAVMDGANS